MLGGQRHAPAALSTGKTRYPFYRNLGGHQGLSGRARKMFPPPGFDPRTVQPVASRYTDLAILVSECGNCLRCLLDSLKNSNKKQ
jgi:hypothetical protein